LTPSALFAPFAEEPAFRRIDRHAIGKSALELEKHACREDIGVLFVTEDRFISRKHQKRRVGSSLRVATVWRTAARDYCVPEAFGRAGVGLSAGALSLVVGPGDVTTEGWLFAVRVRSPPAELKIIVAATNTMAAMPSGTAQPASSVRGRSLRGRFSALRGSSSR
jgi:hypothetical protein